MSPATAAALPRYVSMCNDFVRGRTTASEFEAQFTQAYLNDPTLWDQAVFDILDWLFAEVDEYVGDDDLRHRAGGLDAQQLEHSVRAALTMLNGT